jgi:hypothetical protein
MGIQLVRDDHSNHSTTEYLLAHLLIPSSAAASVTLVVLHVPNDFKLLAGLSLQLHFFRCSSRVNRSEGVRRQNVFFACRSSEPGQWKTAVSARRT